MQLTAKIAKTDDEKRLVTGWAYVSETADGQTVVDSDGDTIDIYELERAAQNFVAHGGTAGDQHERTGVGELVESIVFTPEKIAALGVDGVPLGWLVTFKIDDDEVWQRVKNGELSMLSIGGTANRRENSDD